MNFRIIFDQILRSNLESEISNSDNKNDESAEFFHYKISEVLNIQHVSKNFPHTISTNVYIDTR